MNSPVVPFDRARITELLVGVDAELLQPIIKKAADDFYCTVLETAQDYLQDNLDHNLKSHIAMLEYSNQQMRTALWNADLKLAGHHLGDEGRVEEIAKLQRYAIEGIAKVPA